MQERCGAKGRPWWSASCARRAGIKTAIHRLMGQDLVRKLLSASR
jgi:hypothetical protein